MNTKLFEQDLSILEAWFQKPHYEDECEARYFLGGVEDMEELICHKDGSFSYSEGGSEYPLPRLMVPLLAEYLTSCRLELSEATYERLVKEAKEAEAREEAAEKALRKDQARAEVRLGIIRKMIPSWNDGTGKDWFNPPEED